MSDSEETSHTGCQADCIESTCINVMDPRVSAAAATSSDNTDE